MKYATIQADPPWSFRDRGSRASPSFKGKHYRVPPLEDITRLGVFVRGIAADDAMLYLWAPNAFVLGGEAQDVARAWGFQPKQLIPWVKLTSTGAPAIGMGHYSRVCTEQLLLCRRGKAKVIRRDIPGVILAKRGRHSEKPNEAYELIEALSPGPYMELFARRRFSPRWDVWGDQVAA